MKKKSVKKWMKQNLSLRRLTAILLCICMVLSMASFVMPTYLTVEAEELAEDIISDISEETEDTEFTVIPEPNSETELNNTEDESIEDNSSPDIPLPDTTTVNENENEISAVDLSVPGDEDEHWTLSYSFIIRDNNTGELVTVDSYSNNLSYLEYDIDTTFTVTVQINYKNTNQIMDYKTGELTINLPNLMYGRSAAQISYSNISFGVSTDNMGNYSWKLVNDGADYMSIPVFSFTITRAINRSENFEGAIQITYTMDSLAENIAEKAPLVEQGYDSCLHEFDSHDRVELKTIAESIYSNYIDYNYTREYRHEFKDAKYTIEKKGTAPISIDGILSETPERRDDYYWVKWQLKIQVGNGTMLRYATKLTLADNFPEGCLVYGSNGQELTKTTFDGQEFYIMEVDPPKPGASIIEYYYVGYLKDNFNHTNLGITNTAYLYAKMQGKESEGFVYHDDDSDSVNLGDFDFRYDGGYYAIGKTATSEDTKYYQSITGTDPELNAPFTYDLTPVALYSGFPMNVRVGDDMLYIHSKTGTFRRLEDNEYYFSSIQFPGQMYDGNGNLITRQYEYDLYVRRAGSDVTQGFGAYELNATGTYTPNNARTFSFTKDDAIVAYYFEIKGMEESLAGNMIRNDDGTISLYGNYTIFKNAVVITGADKNQTATSGTIYNFDWINVFNQNGELQNEVSENSYVNVDATVTRDMLANQDMSTYGHYMQRDADKNTYESMSYPDIRYRMYINKNMRVRSFDMNANGWPGTATLTMVQANSKMSEAESKYLDALPDSDKLLGWEYNDYLPGYIDITSTDEEIINSFSLWSMYGQHYYVFDEDGIHHELTENEFIQLIKENTVIEYTEHWPETGGFPCLQITIDLSEHPVAITGNWNTSSSANPMSDLELSFSFDFVYEYEGYLADKVNGRTIENEVLGYFNGRNVKTVSDCLYGTFQIIYNFDRPYTVLEKGTDFNHNGYAYDIAAYDYDIANVDMSSSSYVNLIKEVADDDDETDFTTGQVDIGYGDNYFYRLSMITGYNRLTNIVLYDYLEEYAMDPGGNVVKSSGNRDFWTGAFSGVDISEALSKSYIDNIDIYYSSSGITDHGLYIDADGNDVDSGAVAGARINTAEWTKYDPSVTDPNDVRSLAFDYKNKDGNYATIPATEKLSIMIKMSAPADREYYTYAYNGVWTKWTALGPHENDVIPNITGINSNIVTVALPHSGQSAVTLDIEKTQAVIIDGSTGQPTGKDPTKEKLEVKEGDIVRYYLTITNTGKTPATDVRITDQVPAGLELINDSVSDSGNIYGRVIMWEIDYLDAEKGNNTITVYFDVRVPEDKDLSSWTNVGRVIYDDNDDPDDGRKTEDSNEVEIERYGKLIISKTVTGGGSKTDQFLFKITLTPTEGQELADSYPCSGTGAPALGVLKFEKQEDGSVTATITLSHEQTIKIRNLPAETTYTVEEMDYGDYTVTVEGDDDNTDDTAIGTGVIIVDEELKLAFTNYKDGPEEPNTPEEPQKPETPSSETTETPVTPDDPTTTDTPSESETPTDTIVTPGNPDDPEQSDTPTDYASATGDNSLLMLWIFLALTALSGMIAILHKKKD